MVVSLIVMIPWQTNYYPASGYKREYPYYPYDYSGNNRVGILFDKGA